MANDPFDALYAPLPGEPRPTDPRSRSLGDKYDTFARLAKGYGPWGELTFPTRDAARARLGSMALGFGDEGLGALRSAFGPESYTDALRDERYRNRRLWDTDPGTAVKETVQGLVPWFAAPAGLAGQAAPWLARLAGYTGMGALQGGAQGFGEGEKGLDDRLKHAGTGALFGGALMGIPYAGYGAAKAFPALTAGVAGGALGSAFPSEAQGANVPKGFFSVLEEALRGSKAKSMPADQWKAFLTPGRREVTVGDLKFPLRDEELKWSGLPGYLEGKQPGERVSVDELLAQLEQRPLPEMKQPKGIFARANMEDQPEVWEETTSRLADRIARGDSDDFDGAFEQVLDILHLPTAQERSRAVRAFEREHGIELTEEEARMLVSHEHVTPGNQYKSHVLPGPTTGYGEELTKFQKELPYHEALTAYYHAHPELRGKGIGEAERAFQAATGRRPNDDVSGFKSSHFGSEGQDLLSHSRWSRRQTDDGKPVHVVEEIQSDWHQQGRERGYQGDDLLRGLSDDDRKLYDKYHGVAAEQLSRLPEMTPDLLERIQTVNARVSRARADSSSAVPNAPFSKTYHELELKKNLARAVANGDEYLALTTGTQQADRWNQLLKGIDEIRWNKHDDGTVTIQPMKRGRAEISAERTGKLSPEQLRAFVGKEMAEKIRQANEPSGALTGENLTVGGAGMRHTYDEVYRGYLEKLAKQFGGEVTRVKVPGAAKLDKTGGADWLRQQGLFDQYLQGSETERQGLMNQYQRWAAEREQTEVPAIRITDKMRDRVRKSGLPLFTAPAATGAAGLTGYLGLRAPEDDAY